VTALRARLRLLTGAVVAVTMAASFFPGVASPARAAPAPTALPATPRPELGLAHRLSDGGIRLFRMPLSDTYPGYAVPQTVLTLPRSAGWSFDRSVIVTGSFTRIGGDDGAADFVIWHAMADGSVRMWGVGAGSGPQPMLWHTLRSPWSWASTRLTVGDIDGNGFDDVLVRHRGQPWDRAWAFLSDGSRLGAPVALQRDLWSDINYSRELLSDVDEDGDDDLVSVEEAGSVGGPALYLVNHTPDSGGHVSRWTAFEGLGPQGWSFRNSRQLTGTVSSDDIDDVVTVHRAGDGGLQVWLHENCEPDADPVVAECLRPPVRWQVLRASSGWSFANSRQYLGDTNVDGKPDLISVHRSSSGGLIIWRALNEGTRFGTPQRVTELRPQNGWRWALTRDGVADPYGLF
jgi:hypothetical protein